MTTEKRTIHLTDDNWADYFPDDYPASLDAAVLLEQLAGWPDCGIPTTRLIPPAGSKRSPKKQEKE
jgi:hypothetical protein